MGNSYTGDRNEVIWISSITFLECTLACNCVLILANCNLCELTLFLFLSQMALLPEGITELLHHKVLPLPLVCSVVLRHSHVFWSIVLFAFPMDLGAIYNSVSVPIKCLCFFLNIMISTLILEVYGGMQECKVCHLTSN